MVTGARSLHRFLIAERPDRAPERWLVLRVRKPDDSDSAALVADALAEAGGGAVLEEDEWLTTQVPEPDSPDRWVTSLRDHLAAVNRGMPLEVETTWQPHEEWETVWREGLGPREITPRLVVTPSWSEYEPSEGQIVITIDPGMAFGTAEHATTRASLRLLDGIFVPGSQVLDIGAGSGILSIAAALMGASTVLAIESDPWAVEVARENVVANRVEGQVRCEVGTATAESIRTLPVYDLVMANIQSHILRELLPGFAAVLSPGGAVILSGILAEEWATVAKAAEGVGLFVSRTDDDDGWRSGVLAPAPADQDVIR